MLIAFSFFFLQNLKQILIPLWYQNLLFITESLLTAVIFIEQLQPNSPTRIEFRPRVFFFWPDVKQKRAIMSQK